MNKPDPAPEAGRDIRRTRAAVRNLTRGAVIAALYAALTLAFAPISFGSMQVRIAEALTILPLFTPAAIPGLFVGCILGNLLGGAIVLDVAFGSIATLIGAALGYVLRRNRWLVPVPAVLSNALIVPLVLRRGYGMDAPYLLLALYVGVGEVLGCFVLGELLASALMKAKGLFPGKTGELHTARSLPARRPGFSRIGRGERENDDR